MESLRTVLLKHNWARYSRLKKKKKITNYGAERKLVPIIMDYCLLQFDALKIFLGVRLHGGSQPIFNFFNVRPRNCQRNRKFHRCLDTNFHIIPDINLREIRRKNKN